jgi:hypothetical protein
VDTGALLQRWKRIATELDPSLGAAPWRTEVPPAFFHAFLPEGTRLPELFEEAPSLEPALARLQRIFARLAADPRDPGADAIVAASRAWLISAASIADGLGKDLDRGVHEFLLNPNVEVRASEPPAMSPRDLHPMQSTLYWIVTELGWSMTLSPEAKLLVEPLYQLACSYELAYWVLSPLAPETRDDPLAPAVALWEAGVSLRFEGQGAELRAIAHRG